MSEKTIKSSNNQLIFSSVNKEQCQPIKTNISSIKTQAQTIQINSEENFSNKEIVEEYIKKNYPSFFENFELCDYISSGSSGNVFRGFYKLNLLKISILKIKIK